MDNGLNTLVDTNNYPDDFSFSGGAGVESVEKEGISDDPDNLNLSNFDHPPVAPSLRNMGSSALSPSGRGTPDTTPSITQNTIPDITSNTTASNNSSNTTSEITPDNTLGNPPTELKPFLPPENIGQASPATQEIPSEIDPLNPSILSFSVSKEASAETDVPKKHAPEGHVNNPAGKAEDITLQFTSKNDNSLSDPAGYFERISDLKELDNPEGKAA